MKSFLLKDNKPILKWGSLPQNCFFEGEIPEGYDLAICPSESIVVLDVDVKNGKNGFIYIPKYSKFKKFIFKIFNFKDKSILNELEKTFNYTTKSGGRHYWINYTGNKELKNTSTKYGLDLRVGAKKGNSGGYVKYNYTEDIRNCIPLIKDSSLTLNKWLEKLFSNRTYE